MRARNLIAGSLLLGLVACVGLPPRPTSVKFFDSENRLVGFVDLIEIKDGVRFRVHTLGLEGGVRGLNVHTNPACEGPGFTSAGPVYVGAGRPDSMAAGNLPDITAGTTAWADTTFDWPHLRLDRGDRGLFRNGGTSLVITERPDGQGGGSAGSRRLACGIIKERPEER